MTECPPGPLLQSPLNLSSKDKFLLVLNLPAVLRNRAANDPTIDLNPLQMSVFGTIVPQISVPAVDTRFMGQSVKFTSLNRPEYAPLTLSFIVDNEYKNYYLLWRWLEIYNDPKHSVYTGPDTPDPSLETEYQTTFSIFALNEYNKPLIEFQFLNVFITNLGAIAYNYRESDQLECTADFSFNQLIIKPTTKK